MDTLSDMKLSTKLIQAMKPTATRQEVKDDGCRGLYILCQPSGAKAWACRYYLDGRVRKSTLGNWPAMGLAEARTAAAAIFTQLENDVDPREAEREAAAAAKAERARTFGTIARRFLADSAHLRTIRHIEGILRPVIAEWETRPLATIRRRDIIALIDGIKATRGPGAAVSTQSWLRRVFSWSVEKGEIETSPAAGLRRPAPAGARDRTLSDSELRRLWLACDQRPYPAGRFIQLLVMTGCRRNEIGTLTWADIDLSERTLTIPASRFKTGRAHQVPLARQAVALLEGLPRFDGPFVFSASGGEKPLCGYSWFKDKVDALVDPPLDAWALHDLRRTCRTGLARLRVPESIAERVLGHSVGGIEKVYNLHHYSAEKAQALQLWADFIEEIVTGQRGQVVALRA